MNKPLRSNSSYVKVKNEYNVQRPGPHITIAPTPKDSNILKQVAGQMQGFVENGILNYFRYNTKFNGYNWNFAYEYGKDDDVRNVVIPQLKQALTDANLKESYINEVVADLYKNIGTAGGDLNSAYINTLDNVVKAYETFLRERNNPEFMRQFERLGAISADDEAYGWVYSVRNALLVIMRGKELGIKPTFLKTSDEWLRFNRQVIAGSNPFPMWIPKDARRGYSDQQSSLDAAYEKNGLSAFKGIGLGSVDAQFHPNVGVTLKKGDEDKTIDYVLANYYDISQTEVIKGKEDKFNKTQFTSNITAKQGSNLNKKTSFTRTQRDDMSIILDNLTQYMEKQGIPFTGTGSTGKQLVDGLKTLYHAYYPSADDEMVNVCVQLTLVTCGVGLRYVAPLGGGEYQMTREELANTLQVVWSVCQHILGRTNQERTQTVNESKETRDGLKQKLFNAVKQLGIKVVNNKTTLDEETYKYLKMIAERIKNKKH